jgi:hypothetical protein
LERKITISYLISSYLRILRLVKHRHVKLRRNAFLYADGRAKKLVISVRINGDASTSMHYAVPLSQSMYSTTNQLVRFVII